MNTKKFGYVRVSSKDQNEGRQVESMKAQGIQERDIFIDKQSGKDFNREKYQAMKQCLREGDVVYIHSLDRFGRNKDDILSEWQDITKNIKADIVVLDMPLLDTTKYKDSMGTFISDLVLQILSWMAQEERDRIKKRQAEGIEVALKQGKKFGRPPVELPPEWEENYNKWKNKEITAVQFAKNVNMPRATLYVKIAEYEKGGTKDGK